MWMAVLLKPYFTEKYFKKRNKNTENQKNTKTEV